MPSPEDVVADNAEFLNFVRTAFPVEPLPVQFFWAEGKDSLDRDIRQELGNRISGRPWTEVSLMDWRMVGASPAVARGYFEPTTFMYYVPSIILGVSREIDFVDYALEAIVPHNKDHAPRGKWWTQFSGIASPRQRTAFSALLAHVRLVFWGTTGPANQHLLERAEDIWSS